MKKTISQESAQRLATTEQGSALLNLVSSVGSPASLAAKIGVPAQTVRQWIYKGEIPACHAPGVAKAMKTTPALLRPDLPKETWRKKEPAPEPVEREPLARTEDARLLVRVANRLGGIAELCKEIGCTVDQYRNWKSRGRIPAIKLPTILGLDQ